MQREGRTKMRMGKYREDLAGSQVLLIMTNIPNFVKRDTFTSL